jgi:hypothetical protein
MQARWVIVGMLAVIGGHWLATALLVVLRIGGEWLPYGVYAIAAFGAGALMVAHAPLRPWREPATAGVLAVAAVTAYVIAKPEAATEWFVVRALHPWYMGLGIAAMSGAMAAAGGLMVRRIATATARTNLIVLLSAVLIAGITSLVVLITYESIPALVAGVVAGVAAGGFVTQAMIAPRRPWACGAGGGTSMLLPLIAEGWNVSLGAIAIDVFIGLIFVLIGSAGARLAWRLLRGRDAPVSPEVPSARLD